MQPNSESFAVKERSNQILSRWGVQEPDPRLMRWRRLLIEEIRKSRFLSPLLKPARKLRAWLTPHSVRKLLRCSISIPRQLEIFQLLKLPAFQDLAATYKELPYKYLSDDYLVRDFTVAERASCFLHHYSYLSATFPARLLHQALHGDISVLQINESGNLYEITLGLSKPSVCDKEGELSLHLHVNGAPVFNLSFSVVPGGIVGSQAPDVLLITRIQGMTGCFLPISLATRALHEVAPPALLFAALEGVASAFGIHAMAGVSAARQVSYDDDNPDSLKEAYDDFFAAVGATLCPDNFFLSPLPTQQKPLASIKKGHKTRTRKKRAFKQQVADDVCRLLREFR